MVLVGAVAVTTAVETLVKVLVTTEAVALWAQSGPLVHSQKGVPPK